VREELNEGADPAPRMVITLLSDHAALKRGNVSTPSDAVASASCGGGRWPERVVRRAGSRVEPQRHRPTAPASRRRVTSRAPGPSTQ
jgi:hypothetical protein